MYDHVIIPVDLSNNSLEARVLAVANRMLTDGGKLTLLHIIAPPSSSFAPVESGDSDARAKADEKISQQLQEIIVRNGLPADTEIRVERGRPARLICDSITDVDRHAIVMTSHNPTYTDFLLGSVASQVVKHAECSVVIVRHSIML